MVYQGEPDMVIGVSGVSGKHTGVTALNNKAVLNDMGIWVAVASRLASLSRIPVTT